MCYMSSLTAGLAEPLMVGGIDGVPLRQQHVDHVHVAPAMLAQAVYDDDTGVDLGG